MYQKDLISPKTNFEFGRENMLEEFTREVIRAGTTATHKRNATTQVEVRLPNTAG